MSTIKIKAEGVEATVRKLAKLEFAARKRVLRKAARAGNAPTVKDARANAPRDEGDLKKSITQKIKVYPSGTVVSIVGARSRKTSTGKNPAAIIHLVEAGAKPHVIPGPAVIDGEVRRAIQHPGARAQRFMRRAADKNEKDTIKRFAKKADEEVIREVKKLK